MHRIGRLPEDAARELEHPADLFLEINAPTLSGLYENGVDALFSRLVDPARVRMETSCRLAGRGSDPADTLRHLLAEALYLFETERFCCAGLRAAEATPTRAVLDMRGEALDPERHEPGLEIKAVTYHRLAAGRTDGGWRATLILDV